MTDPFVRAALIGIGRDGAPPTTSTPVDALVAAQDERGFLLRAGARDLYVRAGLRPARASDAGEAAPAETLRGGSPALTALAAEIVVEGDADLLHALFDALREAEIHLPHALLPNVLAIGDKRLRAAAAPVLGERGRWLARRNNAWSWALDAREGDALWEEGTDQQQLDALRAMRAADAAAAREALAERLPQERAEQRASLLGALAAGLSIDDEPLLESALDDRSAAVKEVAIDLLSRLPSSAYVRRMQARAEAAVRGEAPEASSMWAKVKSIVKAAAKLEVEPPSELDAAAARDLGISKIQQAGARALALTRIVGAVPLSSWTSRFSMSPEQLLAKAAETDWAPSLLEGWALAAMRQQNAPWARALAGAVDRGVLSLTHAQKAELARALPAEALMHILETIDAIAPAWPVHALLELVPRPWPRAFAKEWLRRMEASPFLGASTAVIAGRSLPPDVFDIARDCELPKLHQIIRIRKTIAEERPA